LPSSAITGANASGHSDPYAAVWFTSGVSPFSTANVSSAMNAVL
jgi:hypothetical protein